MKFTLRQLVIAITLLCSHTAVIITAYDFGLRKGLSVEIDVLASRHLSTTTTFVIRRSLDLKLVRPDEFAGRLDYYPNEIYKWVYEDKDGNKVYWDR